MRELRELLALSVLKCILEASYRGTLNCSFPRHIRRFRESGLTNKWGSRVVQQTKSQSRIDNTVPEVGDAGDEDEADDGGTKKQAQRKQRVLTMGDLQVNIQTYVIFNVSSQLNY